MAQEHHPEYTQESQEGSLSLKRKDRESDDLGRQNNKERNTDASNEESHVPVTSTSSSSSSSNSVLSIYNQFLKTYPGKQAASGKTWKSNLNLKPEETFTILRRMIQEGDKVSFKTLKNYHRALLIIQSVVVSQASTSGQYIPPFFDLRTLLTNNVIKYITQLKHVVPLLTFVFGSSFSLQKYGSEAPKIENKLTEPLLSTRFLVSLDVFSLFMDVLSRGNLDIFMKILNQESMRIGGKGVGAEEIKKIQRQCNSLVGEKQKETNPADANDSQSEFEDEDEDEEDQRVSSSRNTTHVTTLATNIPSSSATSSTQKSSQNTTRHSEYRIEQQTMDRGTVAFGNQQELNTLKKTNQTLPGQTETLTATLSREKAASQKLQHEKTQLEHKVQELQQCLSTAEQATRNVEQKNKQLTLQMGQQKEAANEEYSALSRQLAEIKIHNEILDGKHQKLITDLSEVNILIEGVKKEKEASDRKYTKLKNQFTTLEKDKQAIEVTVTELKSAVSSAEKATKALEEEKEQFTLQFNRQKEAGEKERSQLNGKLAEIKTNNEELERKVKELEKDLLKEKKATQKVEKQKESADKEYAKLRRQSAAVEKDNQELKDQVTGLESELSRSEKATTTLKKENEQTTLQFNRQKEAGEKERSQLNEQLAELQENKRELEAKVKKLKQDLSRSEQATRNVEQQKEARATECSQLALQVGQLEQALAIRNQENMTLWNGQQQLVMQHTTLAHENAGYWNAIQAMQLQGQQMAAQNNDLFRRNEHLESQQQVHEAERQAHSTRDALNALKISTLEKQVIDLQQELELLSIFNDPLFSTQGLPGSSSQSSLDQNMGVLPGNNLNTHHTASDDLFSGIDLNNIFSDILGSSSHPPQPTPSSNPSSQINYAFFSQSMPQLSERNK